MMGIVFLTGVHGVGKGFLGAPAAAAVGATHYTASQLIRDEKGRASWDEGKRTENIDDNQDALIRAVNGLRPQSGLVVLDGHFVLRDQKGEIYRLAHSVFEQLKLDGVVLLTESSEVISKRLLKRDGLQVDPALIGELAAAAYEHCTDVTARLEISLQIIHSPTLATVTQAIVLSQAGDLAP